MMKALHVIQYNKNIKEALKILHTPIPKPNCNEILIKIKSSSINPIDSWIRKGYGKDIFETQRKPPFILGRDCSGIVVNSNNSWKFKEGDEVFTATDPLYHGCQSEYICIQENYVSLKPKSLNFIEAASLPFIALTGWNAVVEIAHVKEGQQVLIIGASGGVGTFLIQLLKYFNCEVSAICHTRNIQKVTLLGADLIFDYTNKESMSMLFEKQFDIIVDCAGEGFHNFHLDTFSLLKRGTGHLVTMNGNTIRLTDSKGILLGLFSSFIQLYGEKLVRHSSLGVKYDWALFKPNGKILSEIATIIDKNFIKPVIDNKIFNLEDYIEAYDYFENLKPNGKVMFHIN
jgi:NADPH:quinone reductase-like Zn-dependent oxidoreductase